MKHFQSIQKRIVCLLFLPLLLFFAACHKETEYFDYVSELRSNIFLSQNETFSLRAYAVTKESPYAADGIKRDVSPRIEIYLVAPYGEKTCEIRFVLQEKSYGGEMSFDNVRAEYYYVCTLDVSKEQELTFEIAYGGDVFSMTAQSVKTDAVISPKAALQTLVEGESELFASLTDKYGFSGEINIRLLYEDSPYYYVGVIDRKGNSYAFLLNAQTGKLLAKRQS